jgi:hypothetical protein
MLYKIVFLWPENCVVCSRFHLSLKSSFNFCSFFTLVSLFCVSWQVESSKNNYFYKEANFSIDYWLFAAENTLYFTFFFIGAKS